MLFSPKSSLATVAFFICAIVFLPLLHTSSDARSAAETDLVLTEAAPHVLRLTSEQANAMVNHNPGVLFFDVRDPVEIARSGHPTQIDAIVPIMVHSDIFDPELGAYKLVENDQFISEMQSLLADLGLSPNHDVILIGGTGQRSERAAMKLVSAGYKQVSYIADTYADDPKSGTTTNHFWQMAGLPWTSSPDIPGSAWRLALESPNADVSQAMVDPGQTERTASLASRLASIE